MAMDLSKNIRERCHVNSNDEGDSFVGVKADTDDAVIYFPVGYSLPENDERLREDINNLFNVLAKFMKEDKVIEQSKFAAPRTVDFPMHAYRTVIRDYLRFKRYYVESETSFRTDTKGITSWPKTIKEQRGLVQKNGSLIYLNQTVRENTPNFNKKITQIHRYCVYEAFDKMGWFYVPYMPERPGPHPEGKEAISIIMQRLSSTHNDIEQVLLKAMLHMLEYQDQKNYEKQYFFGTDFFERVWEKMVDKAFGNANKELYLPKAEWHLDYGRFDKRKTPALQPDSIMLYEDKVYVLDSKLYRYGIYPRPEYLPGAPDINKQITYGEFIETTKGISSDRIYNAFIMPFNKDDNLFGHMDENGEFISDIEGYYGNIGEAIGKWRPNTKKYERIQGIVVDTRHLMYNYLTIARSEEDQASLRAAIEKVDTRDPVTT